VDAGQRIEEVCHEHNLSQVSFYRWKKQFGQMEVNEAKRLKELERENTEFKKMLADSLLENRVLKFVCEKKLCARPVAGHMH
jgi:putative transposase